MFTFFILSGQRAQTIVIIHKEDEIVTLFSSEFSGVLIVYPDNSELCPVNGLLEYLKRKEPGTGKTLILIHTYSNGPVKSATLAM